MKTAVARISNNVLRSNGSGKVTTVVLLDLSVAFDTIDHEILLNHLAADVGITGVIISWLRSYCADHLSSSRPVICGICSRTITFLYLLTPTRTDH